jgi:hypothetical protein
VRLAERAKLVGVRRAELLELRGVRLADTVDRGGPVERGLVGERLGGRCAGARVLQLVFERRALRVGAFQ